MSRYIVREGNVKGAYLHDTLLCKDVAHLTMHEYEGLINVLIDNKHKVKC